MKERLQKYMSRCGIASRRKCEELILNGEVIVNGNIIDELGFKVDEDSDEIIFRNKVIKPERNKLYIMLNKPTGYITSVKDERGRQTVLDIVKTKERIYPIGRLDFDTSGLILLTNDGNIYNKLMHPSKEVHKVYEAEIKGVPTKEQIERFCNGVDIGGYITSNAKLNIISIKNGNSKVKIVIHEGKNRQIRKMCKAISHPVISLKRKSIGNIKLGELKVGQWRFLNNEEINYIKNL